MTMAKVVYRLGVMGYPMAGHLSAAMTRLCITHGSESEEMGEEVWRQVCANPARKLRNKEFVSFALGTMTICEARPRR